MAQHLSFTDALIATVFAVRLAINGVVMLVSNTYILMDRSPESVNIAKLRTELQRFHSDIEDMRPIYRPVHSIAIKDLKCWQINADEIALAA